MLDASYSILCVATSEHWIYPIACRLPNLVPRRILPNLSVPGQSILESTDSSSDIRGLLPGVRCWVSILRGSLDPPQAIWIQFRILITTLLYFLTKVKINTKLLHGRISLFESLVPSIWAISSLTFFGRLSWGSPAQGLGIFLMPKIHCLGLRSFQGPIIFRTPLRIWRLIWIVVSKVWEDFASLRRVESQNWGIWGLIVGTSECVLPIISF